MPTAFLFFAVIIYSNGLRQLYRKLRCTFVSLANELLDNRQLICSAYILYRILHFQKGDQELAMNCLVFWCTSELSCSVSSVEFFMSTDIGEWSRSIYHYISCNDDCRYFYFLSWGPVSCMQEIEDIIYYLWTSKGMDQDNKFKNLL